MIGDIGHLKLFAVGSPGATWYSYADSDAEIIAAAPNLTHLSLMGDITTYTRGIDQINSIQNQLFDFLENEPTATREADYAAMKIGRGKYADLFVGIFKTMISKSLPLTQRSPFLLH